MKMISINIIYMQMISINIICMQMISNNIICMKMISINIICMKMISINIICMKMISINIICMKFSGNISCKFFSYKFFNETIFLPLLPSIVPVELGRTSTKTLIYVNAHDVDEASFHV